MTDSHDLNDIESKVFDSYQVETPDSSFANTLRHHIVEASAHTRTRSTPRFSLAGRLALAIGSCVLALAILFIANPKSNLVLGMRQLFSFIPGVGIVEEGAPLRQLTEPVAETRAGITVTVDQMILSPDLTPFQFQVSGIPETAYPQNAAEACPEPPYLLLPDGSRLDYAGFNAISAYANAPSYSKQFTLAAVPPEVDNATLVMPCVLGLKTGAAPEGWEFPLSFVPVSAEFVSSPVEEVESQPATVAETALAKPQGPFDGVFTLSLDQKISQEDGDIYFGKISWQDNSGFSTAMMESFDLTDAEGNRVMTDFASTDPSWNPFEAHSYNPVAFKIPATTTSGPLTLTVTRIMANLHVDGVSFSFDAGPNPQIGQQWVLDKDITAGGYQLHLISVTRISNGYEFAFENPEEVGCVDLSINDTQYAQGRCGSNYTRYEYAGDVPTGELTVKINNLDLHLDGTWEYTWMP